MPFTPAQLAAQMNNVNLAQWADSNPGNQAAFMPAYTAYFAGVQAWIDAHGGNQLPFGWDNVMGLQAHGVQVVLLGPAQRAPFNDAFNDVRAHLGTPNFRLYQAAQAGQRLIGVLNRM